MCEITPHTAVLLTWVVTLIGVVIIVKISHTTHRLRIEREHPGHIDYSAEP